MGRESGGWAVRLFINGLDGLRLVFKRRRAPGSRPHFKHCKGNSSLTTDVN